jgi:phosphoribosylaminoimidazole (AIR) synthetase
VHPDALWRTFNMGIGMVLVVPADQAGRVSAAAGLPVFEIGTVVEQSGPERVVLR